MKILQINKRYWDHIGGIETVLHNATEELAKLGHENVVLTVNEHSADVELSTSQAKIIKAGQLTNLFGMPISWRFFSYAQQLFRGVDLVILHHPFPLGFLVYSLFGHNVPLVIWYHSDIVRQKWLAKLLQPLFSFSLRQAQAIIVSNQSVWQSSQLLQPFQAKLVVIPYMVDTVVVSEEAISSIKQQYQLPIILSVGRLVYYKGFEYLIRAMQDLPAQLLIIGSGALKTELRELIASLQLRNVTILDHVEDLSPYYHACQMFVLPSVENSEAFGIVQIEAMLAGKPVINTNLPTAVPTVSIHRQTGLTVEPRNVNELRQAMKLLLTDAALREWYGAAGQQRAQQNYSRANFSDNLARLLKQIVNV